MSTQLYLAQGIVRGRVHNGQDAWVVRELDIARQAERESARRLRARHAR
ncbi:MAG: hypothetical protein WAW88_06730 [Nocardioides sp.]